MRFGKTRQPPPYLNSRDQWRLLGMVAMLLLVFVAIRIAARPQTWAWMFPREHPPVEQQSPKRTGVNEIDHTVRLDDGNHLPSDGFRIPVEKDAERPAESTKSDDESTTEHESSSREKGLPAAASETLAFDAGLLDDVADDTLGIRRTEAAAYYTLLARARDMPPEGLEAAALGDVSYPLLMMEAERFRGRPLSIEGELKRLLPFEPGENNAGIERLYDAWIISADSGNSLYRVVCTEVAEGLPQGDEFRRSIPVRVTGFFFKKEGYAARNGLHTAPVLLAKRIDRIPVPAEFSSAAGLGPYLIGIVVVVAAATAAILWYYSASDRRARDVRRQRIRQVADESVGPDDSLQTEDPVQFLRELTIPTRAASETTSGEPVADTADRESATGKTEGNADN